MNLSADKFEGEENDGEDVVKAQESKNLMEGISIEEKTVF